MAWTKEGKPVTVRIPQSLWDRLCKLWNTKSYEHLKQGEFIKQLLSEYMLIKESSDVSLEGDEKKEEDIEEQAK